MSEKENKQKEFFAQLVEPMQVIKEAMAEKEVLTDIENGIRTFEEKAKYLTKPARMKDEDYRNRVNRIKFLPLTEKMVKINYTRPFTKQSSISSDDEFIKGLNENFDGFGNNLTTFGKKGFKPALFDSQIHHFVDYDNGMENGKKVREARPVVIQLRVGKNILGGYLDPYGRLIHLRFQTFFTEKNPNNIFDILTLRKIWVFNKVNGKVYYDTWVENPAEVGTFIQEVESKDYGFDEIPLRSYYPDDTDVPFKPRLIFASLADKNMEFFESAAEQRDYLAQGRVPILFIKGVDGGDGIMIGKSLAVKAEDPEADMKYVEINGQSLMAGEKYNDRLINEMSQLGVELLNKKVNITATQTSIDNAQNLSLLTAFAIAYQNHLKSIVKLMWKWKQVKKLVKTPDEDIPKFILSIDTDFSTVVDQAELQFLQVLRATGDISGQTITNYAKDKGILPQEFDYDEDQEKMLQSGYTVQDNSDLNSIIGLDNKLKQGQEEEQGQETEEETE